MSKWTQGQALNPSQEDSSLPMYPALLWIQRCLSQILNKPASLYFPFSLSPFPFPVGMYRKKLPLFLKSFLRSFSPCHKTTKETTSKTTYWTRKQRCLGLQEQPKDPQIKLENLQPEKLKCLQQEHSKSLQLKQGCIKEP